MKNFKVLFFLFLVVSTILMSSCSKKDDADIRDDVTGTYNYTLKMYNLVGGTATYLGASYDGTGTMIVKKNESNSTTLDFFEGGELAFQGTKIVAAGNGIAFDIPSQTIKEGTDTYSITGYNYWDLGGTKYNGAYIAANKKVQVAFQYTETVNNVQVTLIMVYEGIKQ